MNYYLNHYDAIYWAVGWGVLTVCVCAAMVVGTAFGIAYIVSEGIRMWKRTGS